MAENKDIPVVILCGGKGTRIREETELIPKPLVTIGEKPILWHIMKIYSSQGFNKFVLLLGYKGDKIKSFFLNYPWIVHNFNIITGKDKAISPLNGEKLDNWEITFLDTGQDSFTGRRLYLAKNLLENQEQFMLTYGDGVADIDLNSLLKFHKFRKDILTVTGVKSVSKQGKIVHENGTIHGFIEKPILDDLINGGFMIMNREIFSYLSSDNKMIEYDLIPRLVKERKAGVFYHPGFWHPMDTFQDKENLEHLWATDPKWRIWND